MPGIYTGHFVVKFDQVLFQNSTIRVQKIVRSKRTLKFGTIFYLLMWGLIPHFVSSEKSTIIT